MKRVNMGSIKNIAFFGILFLLILIYLLPIYPIMPSSGLDPSWSNAINYAFINEWQFGKEIVFTYGPLGSFRFPDYVYFETTYYVAICIAILFAIVITFSLFLISEKANLFTKIISIIAILSGLINDNLFFFYLIPILFIMTIVEDKQNRYFFVVSFFLLFILSFAVLVKFSHFPVVILSVLIADIYCNVYFKRKYPLYTLLLFVFMILLFIASGQSFLNFIDYFIGSFNTLAGYSEAMQLAGPSGLILIFLIFTIGIYMVLARVTYDNKSMKLFTILLITSLILFMAFKQGFTRHDGTTSFAGMTFIFGLLFLYYSSYLLQNKRQYYMVFLFVILAIVTTFGVTTYNSLYTKLAPYVFKKIEEGQSTKEIFKALNNDKFTLLKEFNYVYYSYVKITGLPTIFSVNRIEELNSQYKTSINNIKNQLNLSDINGTVDIYPWDQSFVIANELEFKPRPLFQSYSVYTSKLIENNIDFLKSDKSAENIFFKIEEIDNRLVSTMEGASWLEIMSRYDTVAIKDKFLHLKKRDKPQLYSFKNQKDILVNFNQDIQVPYQNAFVKIEMNKSFYGQIRNVLFESPILEIALKFDDGTVLKKRIVPPIASSGFIISPYIENIMDFFMYDIGKKTAKDVISFKLTNESNCCYQDNIKVKFFSIEKQSETDIKMPLELQLIKEDYLNLKQDAL